MDISRLRKRDIKAWIPVEDEVDVECRHISQGEWEEIKEEATTVTVEKDGTQKKDFDNKKFRSLLGRRAVTNIRGLTDGIDDQERPLPFQVTPENIDMLMEEWTEFRLAVMGSPMKLSVMLKLEREQLTKNS